MTVETDFDRIFELSGGRVELGGAGSEAGQPPRPIEYQWPRIAMGSEELASGALGGESIPSAGRSRLVVNAELVVYGATEPGANVTIQGHPVRINPDGTFRLRLALPDGKQVIPVRATRPDGEDIREVTRVVTCETQ